MTGTSYLVPEGPLVRFTPLILLSLAAGCVPGATDGRSPAAQPDRGYVVMVSFDGLRYDLLDRVASPAFDRVTQVGVRATGLIPGYPTRTFPNQYTLATGLYPANHGLVANSFYDPSLDAVYRLSDPAAVTDGRWYGGEPIWVTAESQGVRSASLFWVGSEAEIRGTRPTYVKAYDGSVPYDARVDTVLHWLSLPREARPRLVMLYFSEPDHTMHDEGVDAPPVDSAIAAVDAVLGRLLDGLERLPIGDRVHLLLVSDHGMQDVPTDQVLVPDDAVDLTGIRVVNNTTQMLLYFGDDTSRVAGVRDTLNARLTHATAYRPEETPGRWHYRGTERIGDLVLAADPGWILRRPEQRPWRGGATHGWDPYYRPMHGIFLARGPKIRAGIEIAAFENVHVYPLVAHLLDLEPAPGIDGRLDIVGEVLLGPVSR